MLRKAIIERKFVSIFYVLLLVLGVLLILSTDQYDLHQKINVYHQSFWDVFFKYATYLGDGILFPIVILLVFFVQRKYTMAFIYAGMMSLVLSFIFKRYLFTNMPRPYEVFGDALHLIEGVKMAKWHSFPSGHTTSAFALFGLLCLLSKKISWQFFFLSLAVLAGISRVYLSQHFVEDVLGGSVLGCSIALVSYSIWLKFPLIKKQVF